MINPEPDTIPSEPSSPSSTSLSLATIIELAHNVGAGSVSESVKPKKAPTAVTIKDNIIVLNVLSNRKSVSHGFLASIFTTLDRYGVVVDLISTSEVYVSMAIEDGMSKKMLDRIVAELRKSGKVCFFCSWWPVIKGLMGASGLCPSRHGDSFACRPTHAPNGRYSWAHVHYPRSRQHQYRDDQSRCQRDQHLMCD